MNKIGIHLKWQILRTRLYLEHLKPRNFVFPLVTFSLTTLLLVGYYSINKFSNTWQFWNEAMGNAFQFCEQNRMDELIRQPSNTWSNLGFFVVGLFALTLGIQDLKHSERKTSANFLVRYPIFSIMFGVSALYLFLGSFMYHASLTSYFQKLDQTGLYSVIIMVITFNIYKLKPTFTYKGEQRSTHPYMIAFALLFNFVMFNWLWKVQINVLFPVMILATFALSIIYIKFKSKTAYFVNYMWAAFFVLLLSSGIWILDRTHVVCSPTSVFQGHALWHLLNAASIFLIYMYYRSGVSFSGEVGEEEELELAVVKD
jgi:hypothetical protein